MLFNVTLLKWKFRETDCQASFDLSPKGAIWLISEKWLFCISQTAEALFFVTFGRAKPAVDFSTPVYIAVVKLKQNRISKMKSVQDVWADLCKTINQKLGFAKLGMLRLCSMLPELHWLAWAVQVVWAVFSCIDTLVLVVIQSDCVKVALQP